MTETNSVPNGWTQETALAMLKSLIAKTNKLKKEKAFSEEHTRWVMNVVTLLEDVFGKKSKFYYEWHQIPWAAQGMIFVDPSSDLNEERERWHHDAYVKQLSTGRGLLEAAKDYLKNVGITKAHTS